MWLGLVITSPLSFLSRSLVDNFFNYTILLFYRIFFFHVEMLHRISSLPSV